MSKQDSRGWEFLRPESDIVLCPECIIRSQHIKDVVETIKNGIAMVISDYPEDINAVSSSIIEIIDFNFGTEETKGPKCANCGDSHLLDEFDSSAWMQINIGNNKKTIWICPDCIEKRYKHNTRGAG